MANDFSAIKPETLRECITATKTWENTANTSWPVTVGPTVLKHKGVYYLFYTANDFRNPDYAVGYATSISPLGPWQKFTGNPVMNKSLIGQNGTGHGDFFKYRKQYYYVFPTHNSTLEVRPRKTAMVKAAFHNYKKEIDRLEFDTRSFYFLNKN